MAGLIWLASYPKSGNTWTRAFLSQYLDVGSLNFSRFNPNHNRLFGNPIASEPAVFDDTTGVSCAEIGPEAVARLRFAFHRDLALDLIEQAPILPPLIKTHDAFCHENGTPLVRHPETERAIVLVRNPLDVAVSYAAHLDCSVDKVIDRMGQSSAAFATTIRPSARVLGPVVGSWSHHVRSWTQQTDIPVLRLRYEDLLTDPHRQFAAILQFLGLTVDTERLDRAVAATEFDKLAAIERDTRIVTEPDDRVFFRRGVSGDWRDHLTQGQVARLVADHGVEMAGLGYEVPQPDASAPKAQSTT